jgi:hypothetical protein
MANFSYTDDSIHKPKFQDFGLKDSVLISVSELNGSVQTVEIPGWRWVTSLNYDIDSVGNRAVLEAFWAKVRGRSNTVSLWHMSRPAPLGTFRGSPLTNGTQAAGSSSLSLKSTTSNSTLLAGDLIGIAGQLLMVTANVTAVSTNMAAVPIAPPLRAAIASDVAVVWDKPTTQFILTEGLVRVPYEKTIGLPFSVDLIEKY